MNLKDVILVGLLGWPLAFCSSPSPPAKADSGDSSESASATQTGPKKLALLIGIDEYKAVGDLEGCVNDIENMASLLRDKFGFDSANIVTLRNEEATREGIIDAFRDLVRRTSEDDIVLLHYSGHGSQMKDAPGGDETDRLDETLVAHDSRMPDIYDIPDDSINGLLAELTQKTGNVTFIFDSCHSGTVARAAGKIRSVEPDDRDPPPPDSFAVTRGTESGEMRADDAKYVLLSGARSDQLANEHRVNGSSHGAFTYFLTNEIRSARGKVTYRDVMDKVVGKVNAHYRSQEPQIEGALADHYLFSDETSLAENHFLVAPGAQGNVKLAAGRVQGMTKGSVFDVYPPGTKAFGDDVPVSARVELMTVDAFESEGKILSGGPIEEASRAVERVHRYPDQKLRLHYVGLAESDALQRVKEELDSLGTIETLSSPVGYDLLLDEIDGAIITEGGDGYRISPPVALTEPDPVGHVVEQVTHWSQWFNVLGIENQTPELRVRLDILSEGGSGSNADETAGLEFGVGEIFEISVQNQSEKELYLTVLDLATDGSIAVVYPPSGAVEKLSAGQEWTRRVRTTLPAGRDRVRDVVKVFGTSEPVDFTALTLGAVRALDDPPQNPLAELIEQATTGRTRGLADVGLDDWVTTERVVLVKRGSSSD